MIRMQRHSHGFLVLLLVVFISGLVLSGPSTPRRSRVRRQNMKVRINATGDTIVMKFVRPNTDSKLEGYILGYGSSMFSKQFIPLPENGQPYETEFDAEPKYLIAVQSIPTNDVKKHCTGKVELEKPLHLVIGSVTPTSVLLSWGTLLKTPYEGNIMNECLEDGHYTVRYRERNRKWNYQTCPTSDTVIDNLKPNTVYEFGVQPSSKDKTGSWSKPVIHNISSGGVEEKVIRKIFKRPISPVKPIGQGPHFPFVPRHVLHNRTQGRLPLSRNITPKTTTTTTATTTTLAPTTTTRQEALSTPGPVVPATTKEPFGGGLSKSVISLSRELPLVPILPPLLQTPATTPSVPAPKQNGGQSSRSHASTLQKLHQPPLQSKPKPQQSQPGSQAKSVPQHEPNLEPPLQPITYTPIPNHYHQTSWLKHQTETQSTQKTQTKSKPQTKPQPLSPPQLQPETPHHPTTLLIHQSKTVEVRPKPSPPAQQHLPLRNKIQTTQSLPRQPLRSTPDGQIETQSQPMVYFQTTFQPYARLTNAPEPHPKSKNFWSGSLNPTEQPLSWPKTQPGQPAKSQNPITTSSTLPQTLRKTRPQPQSPFSVSSPSSRPEPPSTSTSTYSLPQSESQPKAILAQAEVQPGIQFPPLGRTHSGPTEVIPLQAVPTARPSPTEKGNPLPIPALDAEEANSYNLGNRRRAEISPVSSSATPVGRNTTFSRLRIPPHFTRSGGRSFSTSSHSISRTPGAHHRSNALPKPGVWPKEKPVLRPSVPVNKRPNLVGKPNDHDKPMDLKQGDKESILKPFPLVTSKPKQERRQQTTTTAPLLNGSRFDINENSSIFRPLPASDVDIMGKKRYVAPHVIYKTDKKPDEPCSITSSLTYFPDEEDGGDQNVTAPPRIPPSNLTVVTVEGCPSFVILDWQKSDNETREYEVVSTAKGPNGEEVSILTTTNQTHTAVENLKPESSYEFKVTPKNELGTGPSSEPVSFNTESADPRVSENVSGKDAIWTQFPFKADAYSECNGKQYVKRTWYRKFVGIQLCNSLRYKIYLSDSLNGKFYNIGDQTGHGEDHCQFVDSFLDGRTGTQMFADQLPSRPGFFRALRQEPVSFGEIGGKSHVTYVGWYECGTPIPGKW
ncbi:target of Nesh-SH3 isoform X1 [Dunckerocampus dactyliophorus]|uniref:target of Nesh-SH3 isoform X1 n=1 Tax=Dunckerocampus dactyliophorus TaxID=161453 RepID=UPI002404BCE9|nr:target of Nesh-SH3 isoform X1 [Dunckerocampus dactyliophorus]